MERLARLIIDDVGPTLERLWNLELPAQWRPFSTQVERGRTVELAKQFSGLPAVEPVAPDALIAVQHLDRGERALALNVAARVLSSCEARNQYGSLTDDLCLGVLVDERIARPGLVKGLRSILFVE
jgi:hypothetical protein